MDLPLTRFDGVLKYHRFTFNNEIGSVVLSAAFPAFLGDQDFDKAAAARKMKEQGVDQVMIVDGPAPRRFAGDVSLPRGCYSSVCMDELGNDRGTVANELAAYWEPKAGLVTVHDVRVPEDMDLFRRYVAEAPGGIFIELLPYEGEPNPVAHELFTRGLLDHGGDPLRPVLISIPLMIQEVSIDDVFDLRRLETQRWLTEFLPEGDDVLSKPGAEPLESFLHMVPSLTFWDRGGDAFTEALGTWLRLKGASGLVFPSARSDVTCEFTNGELTHARGWNFVDYREAGGTFNDVVVDMSPWQEGSLKGVRYVRGPDDGPHAHSWRIEGRVAAQERLKLERLEEERG